MTIASSTSSRQQWRKLRKKLTNRKANLLSVKSACREGFPPDATICSNPCSRSMLGLVATDFMRRRRTHDEEAAFAAKPMRHLERETSSGRTGADSATLLGEIFV
jgi:hypothetical protein